MAMGLLLAAGVLGARSCRGPRIDFGPYEALGTVAGREAGRLMKGAGGIVLIVPDDVDGMDPVLASQYRAFRTALAATGGAEVKSIEIVALDPSTRMQTGGAVPPDRYLAIRGRHAAAVGFVLFQAFPPLTEAEIESLEAKPAKVLVMSAALPGYDRLLRAEAIDVAIVPRPSSADTPAAPAASLEDAFDREYVILRGGQP